MQPSRSSHVRSSDDSKSLNVELGHDRCRGNPLKQTQKMCQMVAKHVLLMKNIRFNVGDETLRDRSGQPVVHRDDSSHEQTMLNEVNMDFRIPGQPHSVVKHAQNTSVREMIQKIENHPDQASNPFSTMTKQMIQDVGNVELFELFETDPKIGVQSMPIILA